MGTTGLIHPRASTTLPPKSPRIAHQGLYDVNYTHSQHLVWHPQLDLQPRSPPDSPPARNGQCSNPGSCLPPHPGHTSASSRFPEVHLRAFARAVPAAGKAVPQASHGSLPLAFQNSADVRVTEAKREENPARKRHGEEANSWQCQRWPRNGGQGHGRRSCGRR